MSESAREPHTKKLAQYMVTDPETGLEACGFCQKVYKGSQSSVRKQNLTDHIYSVHLKVKRHKCRFCDNKFSSKSGLFNHVKSKHPEENDKKLQVKKEDVVFEDSNEIKNVEKSHLDEKADDITIDDIDPFKYTVTYNPWQVESLEAFAYLKCPECPFDCKEDIFFQAHALENHPLSIAFFGQTTKIKEELPDSDIGDDYGESLIDIANIKTEENGGQKVQKVSKVSKHRQKRGIPVGEVRLGTYSCNICKVDFSLKKYYKDHITIVQDGKKLLKCCACDARFSSFNGNHKLIRHIASVHEGKKHNCALCAACFEEREDLIDHELSFHDKKVSNPRNTKSLKVEVKEGENTYSCSICSNEFAEFLELRKHTAKAHDGKKIFKCPFCTVVFPQMKDIKAHLKKIHGGKKPHNCSFCDAAFLKRVTLRYHIKSLHEKEKPLKCPTCLKGFRHEAALKYHISVVHDGVEPIPIKKEEDVIKERFPCSQCNKTYINKKGLRIHVENVHLKLKKFQCDQCPSVFASRQGFKYHMESEHENTDYPCTKCDRIFKTIHCLKNHVLRHHEKRLDFKCEHCGKDYPTLTEVNRHVKVIHSNNVKCEICDKTCYNPKRLWLHKVLSHNADAWRCEKCPRKQRAVFQTQATYEKHMKKFHYF